MKRIVWFVVGVFAGAVGTVSGRRRVRRRLGGSSPVVAVRHSADRVRGRVGDAVREGRRAMHDRESDLRARVEGSTAARRPVNRSRHPR